MYARTCMHTSTDTNQKSRKIGYHGSSPPRIKLECSPHAVLLFADHWICSGARSSIQQAGGWLGVCPLVCLCAEFPLASAGQIWGMSWLTFKHPQ